eukprot:gnl/Trimastix_PCT/1685.p1 GENE.gnl/Trimastix_PCT/1685~~gnl/Trimastix_PCT/1685.p1  ORF type:complete len:180 (+),score=13.89 gnl/Trimastix_PCT/1685:57-542(+)
MPKKGKKGKKGRKKKGASREPEVPFEYARPEELNEEDPWVTLNIHLISWTFLDFTVEVPTSTRLHSVIEMVRKQHGYSVYHFEMYKNSRQPENELRDPLRTLHELGIQGGPRSAKVSCEILYDFKANPIPQDLLVPEVKLKEEGPRFGLGSMHAYPSPSPH